MPREQLDVLSHPLAILRHNTRLFNRGYINGFFKFFGKIKEIVAISRNRSEYVFLFIMELDLGPFRKGVDNYDILQFK
jgi:hypothetical protein